MYCELLLTNETPTISILKTGGWLIGDGCENASNNKPCSQELKKQDNTFRKLKFVVPGLIMIKIVWDIQGWEDRGKPIYHLPSEQGYYYIFE